MSDRPPNDGGLNNLGLQIAAYLRALKIALRGGASMSGMEDALEQFPDVQLEIGNELLITHEIAQIYNNLMKSIGRIVIIDQISTNDGTIRASAFGIQVAVNMKVARHMRAAFLHQEQAF